MADTELTKYLAALSKIDFTDDELERMSEDMTDIIALMDKVCGFDPAVSTYALDAVNYNDLRKDEAKPSYPTDEIVSNAEFVKNNSFVVPKVV